MGGGLAGGTAAGHVGEGLIKRTVSCLGAWRALSLTASTVCRPT